MNEREKRMQNELYAKEFQSMMRVNMELISKCRVLEKQVAHYHKTIQSLQKNSARNST